MTRIIQCNLNRSPRAFDLLTQEMTGSGISIAIIAEPPFVADNTHWLSSTNQLAAIYWRPNISVTPRLIARSRGVIAVKLGEISVVSCYISPNVPRGEFLEFVDELSDVLNLTMNKTLVGGDFNAKSVMWGSTYSNERGNTIEDWAAEQDLRLLNTGAEPTCLRAQGTSIVDLSWATPNLAQMVTKWEVLDITTLSDHAYIKIEIAGKGGRVAVQRPIQLKFPRWNWKKADWEKFQESLLWSASSNLNIIQGQITAAEDIASKLDTEIRYACDNSTTRLHPPKGRCSVYWWSDDIFELRREANQAYRRWKRCLRRRNIAPDVSERCRVLYKVAHKKLRRAIGKAKANSWKELLDTIEEDPWGLPYKLVLRRLRDSSSGILKGLEERQRVQIIETLFPEGETHDPTALWREWQEDTMWQEEWDITPGELHKVIRRRSTPSSTAPGVDGIPAHAWKRIPEEFMDKLEICFNTCMRQGIFPRAWKKAILVLIPKAGQLTDNGLPKVRPICLLNEVGKALERILADRIKDYLKENPAYDLSPDQFGFREGKSTYDAVANVCRVARTAMSENGYTIAVSLDISNAFNSVPWRTIREALIKKNVPEYLRRILDSYLHDRYIAYIIEDEKDPTATPVTAGVPQGSVLGPLLWNIAFDSVLRDGTERGCHIVCYADDTLIMASADTTGTAIARVNLQIAMVLNRIRRLGLTVSASKTEAIIFYGKNKPRGPVNVQVGDEKIAVGQTLKYLGIMLDSKLSFKPHFEYVEKKIAKVSRALGRLMPNLRGPGEGKRRLYANVVLSIFLYGAPIWNEAFAASRNSQSVINKVLRSTAIRVISGYRTVSLDAALLIARIPPAYLLANMRRRTYDRVRDLRDEGRWSLAEEKRIKSDEELLLRRQWELHLGNPNISGTRTRDAILPSLHSWLDRRHGGVSFRVTQILTGHGCFGSYLYRIGKVADSLCEHCREGVEDSPEHTLAECKAWEVERGRLCIALNIGDNEVSLREVMARILDSPEGWGAFVTYANTVMLSKESAERERQANEAQGADDRSDSSYDP